MPDADNQAPAATNPEAPAASGSNNPTPQQQPDAAPAAGELASLPEWAQTVIKDLRKEQAQRRKQAQEAEAAAKTAEEQQLAARQEWQKLAEQRAVELANLTPVAERYAALSSEIAAQLEAEIKTWPAEVTALRPPGADAAALMAWAKTARPLAQRLTQASQPPVPGQGQPPKPAGQGGQDAAKAKADFARTVRSF